MAKPLFTIVGYCTPTSAKIMAVFDHAAARSRPRLAYRCQDEPNFQSVETNFQPANPYLLAQFELENLPSSADGTRIQYNIEAVDQPGVTLQESLALQEFKLLPAGRPVRFALLSCNGAHEVMDPKRRYFLWRALKEQVDQNKIDFIIHAGDQIYADAIRTRYARTRTDRFLAPEQQEQMDLLTAEYRRFYVESWSAPEVACVLASCPSIMMWDDHEIYNGYGSTKEDSTPSARAFFKAAKQAFLEFQMNNNPARLGVASQAFAFQLNDSGFLILDGRSNRDYFESRVLGKDQLEDARLWLTSMIPQKLRYLNVVIGIPIVHVRVVGYLNFVNRIGLNIPMTEDLRDSWSAPNNQQECKQLLTILFDFLHNSPDTRLTTLSGDAHVATIGEIQSALPQHHRPDGTPGLIYQVVSSGIGSLPPRGIAGLVLRMAVEQQLTLICPDFYGTLLKFPGRTSCMLARRNFAIIHSDNNAVVVRFFAEEGDEIIQIEQTWTNEH